MGKRRYRKAGLPDRQSREMRLAHWLCGFDLRLLRLLAPLWSRRQSLALLGLVALARHVIAESATLTWAVTADPRVAFWRVYVGTNSGQFFTNFPVVTNRATWPLPEPGRYYFTVTACDTDGNQSRYAPEIMAESLPAPSLGQPAIGLVVDLQASGDLTTWHPQSLTNWQPATNPAQFYRRPALRILPARLP